MICAEAQELITALVDEELSDPERSSLQSHLKDCARCRSILEEERALKTAIRAAGVQLRAPVALRNRILSDQRIFPDPRGWARGWRSPLWASFYLRPALVTALLIMLVLPVLYLFGQRSQPISLAALESYDLFLRGDLPLIRAESPAEIKEQLIHAVGGRFEPMDYDLTAMNMRPVAGAVRDLQGRKVLVAIYRGERNSLFCYTFLGSARDAPAHAARFFDADKKIDFYAFSRGALNAVLHREGDVICILASEMPIEQLLALARSKARQA